MFFFLLLLLLQLCRAEKVEGFPTLKYYFPTETHGTEYEGDRSFIALFAFARSYLVGATHCTPDTLHACSEPDQHALSQYQAMEEKQLARLVRQTTSDLKVARANKHTYMNARSHIVPSLRLMQAALKHMQQQKKDEL